MANSKLKKTQKTKLKETDESNLISMFHFDWEKGRQKGTNPNFKLGLMVVSGKRNSLELMRYEYNAGLHSRS